MLITEEQLMLQLDTSRIINEMSRDPYYAHIVATVIMYDMYGMTYQEIASFYGVSRERARQWVAKGSRGLGHPSRSRRLKQYR